METYGKQMKKATCNIEIQIRGHLLRTVDRLLTVHPSNLQSKCIAQNIALDKK